MFTYDSYVRASDSRVLLRSIFSLFLSAFPGVAADSEELGECVTAEIDADVAGSIDSDESYSPRPGDFDALEFMLQSYEDAGSDASSHCDIVERAAEKSTGEKPKTTENLMEFEGQAQEAMETAALDGFEVQESRHEVTVEPKKPCGALTEVISR